MSGETDEKRPRPLLHVAFATGGLLAVLTSFVADIVEVLTVLGLSPELADPLSRIVIGLITLLAALGVWRFGELFVTPNSDPRDSDLAPLVPADGDAALHSFHESFDAGPPIEPGPGEV